MGTRTDPVCGLDLDPNDNQFTSELQASGTTIFFCSEDCKMEFDQSPKDYL